MDQDEITEILSEWCKDNPDKNLTRSCPNFENKNSIFIWYTVNGSKEEIKEEISLI